MSQVQREIEIRVTLEDAGPFLEFLQRNAQLVGTVDQLDVYLEPEHTPFLYTGSKGELKADKWLRVRSADESAVLCLKEVVRDGVGNYLYSNESEVGVSGVEGTIALLARLGFREVIRIRKRRKEWIYGQYRIARDEIDDLGVFFEVEVEDDKSDFETAFAGLVDFIQNTTGTAYQRVTGGYPQLIWQRKRQSEAGPATSGS